MRRILIIVAIVIAVIVVGLLVAVSLIDVNKYRPQIQTELQNKLGRPVTLGQLHLRVLPLSVGIDGLTIGESPSFASTLPFAKASDVYVSVGLLSLISGHPQVNTVELTRPQIEVIRNAQGVWNFSTIGAAGNQPGGAQAPSSGSSSSISLGKLKITDGQVALTDAMQHQPRSVYDHIDAEITDFAPNKPFGVDLSVHLPGQGKELMVLKAKVGPIQGVPSSAIAIKDGHYNLQEVSLAGFSKFAQGAIPPNTDSVISGEGSVDSEKESVAVKGDLKLENTTIRGVKIDYPIDATADLTANRQSNLLTIRSSQVKLGSTPINLSGTIDNNKTPADLDVKLKAQNASLVELARLAGAAGVAFSPNYQIKGTLNADVAAKGPSNSPQLTGTVQAKQLEASGGDIKQPVSVPEVDLTLTPTSIVSSPFVAQSGSTRLNIGMSLSQYTTPNPNVDATVSTQGANVAELLNIAKAYGVDGTQGATASGNLSLNVHVTGPLKDTSKLVYSGTGNLANVNLTTPSLTKPVAVRSANLRFAQNGAAIDNLAAAIGNSDLAGSMSANNLLAPQVQFALTSNKIDVDELEQLTPPAKSTQAAANAPKTTAKTPAANEPSLLNKTTGTGTLAAKTLVAQGIVLTNVKATTKLDHGLITLSPLTANLFGGSENGTIALDTRPAVPTCSVNTKLTGVDTNQLLSSVSSVKNRLYGSLQADAKIAFALASGPALARSLNGPVSFNVTNGKIVGINILNQLSQVGKFLGAAPSQGGGPETALKKFSGLLNITNGVASTNNLVAALNEGSLSANGSLNLVDEGINMKMTAVLSSGTSQSVGGSKVGGFMNTALANSKGELVIPVNVTGTMEKPVFTPDAQAIAQMKLKNLLPTSGDPGKLTSGIVGSVLGNKGGAINSILGGGQQQQGQGQANKPGDVVNSILGQFGKKKKK